MQLVVRIWMLFVFVAATPSETHKEQIQTNRNKFRLQVTSKENIASQTEEPGNKTDLFQKTLVDPRLNKTKPILGKSRASRCSIQRGGQSRHSHGCFTIPVSHTSICPEGFQYILSEYCGIIKENQNFPPSCPYPNFEENYSVLKRIQQKFDNKTFWVYASRSTKTGFPEFEWISKDLYGLPVLENLTVFSDSPDKECMIVKDDRLYGVSCYERHAFICMYSYRALSSSKAKYACQGQDYSECILADYDLSEQKCFCQKINNSRPTRNKFCEKLAEPIYPYQTELLISNRGLFNKYKCWIGLYNEKAGVPIYKWELSNQTVNYTSWTGDANCKFSQGAFQFIKDSRILTGWTFLEDNTTNCALCEVLVKYEIPSLKLTQVGNNIQLRVENMEGISNLGDVGFYDIHCFADYSEEIFKENILAKVLASAKKKTSKDMLHIPLITDRPSHYWCEAFMFHSFSTIVSNTIVGAHKSEKFGYEFALEVYTKIDTGIDPFVDKTYANICKTIKRKLQNELDFVASVRPMRGYFDKSTFAINLLTHISTRNNRQSAEEHYDKMMKIFNSMQNVSMQFSNLRYSEKCLFTTSTTVDGKILEWPATRIGEIAIPSNRLCLDKDTNMLPVTRECEGNFLYGSRWGIQWGRCFSNDTYSEITEELFNITKSEMPPQAVLDKLFTITQTPADKQIDIYLISVILEELSNRYGKEINIEKYVDIVNNVMKFEKYNLHDAQILLNSSDRILSSLDNLLNNRLTTSLVSPQIVAEAINLKEEEIIGLALFKRAPIVTSFEQYYSKFLYKNTSLEDLLKTINLEIVVLLPTSEKNKMIFTRGPSNLVVTIFYNDTLFDINSLHKIDSKVVSVSLPGFVGFLETPLQIWFRSYTVEEGNSCAYWDYGIDGLMISKRGNWAEDSTSKNLSHLLKSCEFFHMTHFGLLVSSSSGSGSVGSAYEIISIIGSSLSLIGIIPIFITALFFKNWRIRTGNIILLNFCAAITFQIFVTFSLYAIEKDGVVCKIIGACLHYSVLLEFCWMCIVAFLEYRRFVVIFGNLKPNFLKKVLFFGWLSPLVPVLLTVAISPDNYTFNELDFCSVSGIYFVLFFLVPIILILINNLIIFIKIIYTISRSSLSVSLKRRRNYKFEILLAILLFFILGLSWIFYVIAALGGGAVFTYLFFLFATLRGLILFLFFIIGNKETRMFWFKHSGNINRNTYIGSAVGCIKSVYSSKMQRTKSSTSNISNISNSSKL